MSDGAPASWVIREKSTGRAVLEVWSASVAAKVNTAKYEAVPILQHLQELNRSLRQETTE